MLVFTLDIGGTSIKQALVRIDQDRASVARPLPTLVLESRDFDEIRAKVLEAVRAGHELDPSFERVGISTSGSVDRSGIVVSAGHFHGYQNVDWNQLIRKSVPSVLRVSTYNDGRASAWAEFVASGHSARAMSHIHAVVGTGVGGGIVHDGELLFGDSGQAGYIGHIKVTDNETPICSCGNQGCVEALAASPALIRRFTGDFDPATADSQFRDLVHAAMSGNETALGAFQECGRWLGVGLGDAMNVLNPSSVSIGGGVTMASTSLTGQDDGGPFISGVRDGIAYAAHKRVAASASLQVSRLGNDGGLLGAAALASR